MNNAEILNEIKGKCNKLEKSEDAENILHAITQFKKQYPNYKLSMYLPEFKNLQIYESCILLNDFINYCVYFDLDDGFYFYPTEIGNDNGLEFYQKFRTDNNKEECNIYDENLISIKYALKAFELYVEEYNKLINEWKLKYNLK